MVFLPIILNICQTFPIKHLQNQKMFTGLVKTFFVNAGIWTKCQEGGNNNYELDFSITSK